MLNEPERDDDPTKVITLLDNATQPAQKWRPPMNKAFVITAVLMLSPFPAFGQHDPGGEGHDSSYSRRDRDLEDILRGMGDHGREGSRRAGGHSRRASSVPLTVWTVWLGLQAARSL